MKKNNKFNLLDFNLKKLKSLSLSDLLILKDEIRLFIKELVDKTGGHYSSNLGLVELQIALHYIYSSPKDQIIFDTGHQAYTHKILTNRGNGLNNLHTKDGCSGLIKRSESKHDLFETGHSGTSLSALMGFCVSNKFKKHVGETIAIVGDASFNNGINLEALNLISYYNLNSLIIINNNMMSISENVGIYSNILNDENKAKTVFESMNYKFFYLENGNDLEKVINLLKKIKEIKGPKILLLKTIKGYGDTIAENDKLGIYHYKNSLNSIKRIGHTELIPDLLNKLRKDNKFFLIQPSMGLNTGLYKFEKENPNSYIDVGIEEEHAAAMASGMANNDVKVVLSYYNTFSQRAFDNILNDLARPNLDSFIILDRSYILEDNPDTHQGIYAGKMFELMPNTKILAPYDLKDYIYLFNYGIKDNKGVKVLFHPKGDLDFEYNKNDLLSYDFNNLELKENWLYIKESKNPKINIISYGRILKQVTNVLEENTIEANLINARFIKPVDNDLLKELFLTNQPILIIEEQLNVLYDKVLEFKEENNFNNKIYKINLDNQKIIESGLEEIYSNVSLSKDKILMKINHILNK